jgi:hypothetical protein
LKREAEMNRDITPFNITLSSNFRKWLRKKRVSKKEWEVDPINIFCKYYGEWLKVSKPSPSVEEKKVMQQMQDDIEKMSSLLKQFIQKWESGGEDKKTPDQEESDIFWDFEEEINEVMTEYPKVTSPKRKKRTTVKKKAR